MARAVRRPDRRRPLRGPGPGGGQGLGVTPPRHGISPESPGARLPDSDTLTLRLPDPPPDPAPGPPADGGRAARRRAAAGRGGAAGGHGRRKAPRGGARARGAAPGGPADSAAGATAGARPLSRVEARRLARERRPGAAAVLSRAVGELFISVGVVMLLFVTYQMWWTNVRAGQSAADARSSLQDRWAQDDDASAPGKRGAGAFEPGEGFALLHIPKLDVVVPIAEGVDKEKVLDRGMVGHYAEGGLRTAMPEAKRGNFGLAGHRNTHGEPFRFINRLKPGDAIVVETRDTFYTYDMASILPQTPPSNTDVLDAVPAGSGFEGPGRYITLTTCTPEFTSTFRLIVWGKMVDERPREDGRPDALVG
ncbi:class E sortase [Streptomyces sp. NPDC060194]|uniref:class E sortase n=1 Tax=Streptomyces sp. NPDC060194 TaxID=3347069 RepID=UPI0036659558